MVRITVRQGDRYDGTESPLTVSVAGNRHKSVVWSTFRNIFELFVPELVFFELKSHFQDR
jgi:predicted nucleic acid-binding protein